MRDGEWHHIVVTKSGSTAALYVDGTQEHSTSSATGSGDPAASPWHVMRNGTNDVYAAGEADEVALYTRALGAAEIRGHYDLANRPRRGPLPDAARTPPGGRAAAGRDGTGRRRAGAPEPLGARPARPRARCASRRGTLIARGAPGVRNNLIARRRGRNWIVRDSLAAPARGARLQARSARGS